MRNGKKKTLKVYLDLNTQHYLRLLVTILFSFITAAILLYPERFQLGPFPFSFLGRKFTPSGLRNIYARIVFDAGMFLCGYTMYLLARYYQRKQPVPDSHMYEFLSYLSAGGFLLMVVPCDVTEVQFLHSIGSGFVVGSHFFMATIRILAVQQHMKQWVAFILLSVLLLTVLFYAFMWFLDLPYHPFFQKPAFAAIIYVELHGSSFSRFQGERKASLSLQSERTR
jgi:hypothetical protein